MRLSSADKKILLILYQIPGNVNVYEFHKRFSFSPAQLSRFTRRFQELDIIEYSNETIKLTEHGKAWILNNRKEIFLTPPKKPWVEIPHEWKNTKKFDDIMLDASVLKKTK
ncbi:MAG: hypothetical protein P9M09_01115 [Candidatus Celaenobacter antarcticus]|nr:hypothetical protein [Candidatus Celaenobacter antarcticus]